MKVELKVSDKVTITAEGETQLDVFEQLGTLQEVFGERSCGKCDNTNLTFRVRRVTKGKAEYIYPELQCRSCYAKLTFGQKMEDKTLFPHRKNDDGTPKGMRKDGKSSRGWVIFNKETNTEE